MIESILVGIYTCFIYLLFAPFIKNLYVLLLVSGFFKHFLGSSFGLWTWYCNNGHACVNVLSQDQYYISNTTFLLRESIYESILFFLSGSILTNFIKIEIYLFFLIGFMAHLISDYIGIHKHFCKQTCDIINEQNN
jgi:hypothetical protein